MADLDLDYVRQHYSSLVTEELVRLRDNEELTDEARPILLEELTRRGVDSATFSQQSVEEVGRRPEEAAKQVGGRQIRKALAFVVCTAIFITYFLVGTAVFQWKHGGGFIPLLVLGATIAAVWRKMTK